MTCVANNGDCTTSIPNAEPGGEYQFWLIFPPPPDADSSTILNKVDFRIAVDSWDGIPET